MSRSDAIEALEYDYPGIEPSWAVKAWRRIQEANGKMIVLGCDPGLDGAIAVYRPHDDVLQCHKMPTLRVKAGSDRRVMDDVELARLVDVICKDGVPTLCVIEGVGPGQSKGTVASFHLGANFGVLRGVIAANFIPVEFVAPRTWKKALKIPAGADKQFSIGAASRAFPRSAGQWSSGGRQAQREGAAEAALLALYGHRHSLQREAA